MLREISCELFRADGKARPPVRFHPGLNIILGGNTGVNSIGKSTILLIIDFVFGGDSYIKSDAVKQLGDHAIHFAFEFEGEAHHFLRSTADPGIIVRLDAQRQVSATVKKEEFINWLRLKYRMDFTGLRFRDTLSRFFRIYGKNNYNELRPLQTRGGSESQEQAIQVLVKLYNQYESILVFEEQLKQAEERITAFRQARKYQFVPSAVDGSKKYEENVASIALLKNEKAQLERSNHLEINAGEIEKANQTNALMVQMRDARRLVREKESDLHLIDLNISQGVYPTEADLSELRKFFPDADLKKLVEIERFHNKIQVILQEELDAAKARLQEELLPLQQQADALEQEVQAIRPSMAFSTEFLAAYTLLDRRIHKLEDENEAFDTRKSLQADKDQASARLKTQMRSVLSMIESTINSEMSRISDEVSGGKDNPPVLDIREYNSYSFETPKDTGTGTNFKAMLIYDISILNTTALPALAHDSLLFANVSDETVEQILSLYADEKHKQVFIAFDREGNYSPETQALIKENTVLKLDADEQALFGWKWGRKETPHEDSI